MRGCTFDVLVFSTGLKWGGTPWGWLRGSRRSIVLCGSFWWEVVFNKPHKIEIWNFSFLKVYAWQKNDMLRYYEIFVRVWHCTGCEAVKYQNLTFQDWKEVNGFTKWNKIHLIYFQLVYILQSWRWMNLFQFFCLTHAIMSFVVPVWSILSREGMSQCWQVLHRVSKSWVKEGTLKWAR